MVSVNPRHLELEKRSQDLLKEGKSLDKEDFNEDLELMSFRIILSDEIFWRRRREFALIMQDFVNSLIEIEEFETKFSLLYSKTNKEYQIYKNDLIKLEKLELDPRSSACKFSSFIVSIFREFEVLEDGKCSEQDLKELVRNLLDLMQVYL